jgi:hypothetical protein
MALSFPTPFFEAILTGEPGNKRELARVLVRMLGVWIIASGVTGLIPVLWQVLSPPFRFRLQDAYLFTMPLVMFLNIAIGLLLFFKGAWIANKLVQVDDSKDP